MNTPNNSKSLPPTTGSEVASINEFDMAYRPKLVARMFRNAADGQQSWADAHDDPWPSSVRMRSVYQGRADRLRKIAEILDPQNRQVLAPDERSEEGS
jgi:hypothetical protein